MLFHDRVSIDGPREIIDYDKYGQPIFGPGTSQVIPAHVGSSSTTDGGQTNAEQLISRYLVLLRFPAGFNVDSVRSVEWRGKTLRVDGAIMPQMLRGRVHHHSFTSERVTG